MSGDGNLLVEGRVEGNVSISGEVRVARGAVVEGDVIEASALDIAGSVEGELRISGQVHAAAGSRVRGNVIGGTLSLADGASFEGRIENDFSLPPELEGGGGETGRSRRR